MPFCHLHNCRSTEEPDLIADRKRNLGLGGETIRQIQRRDASLPSSRHTPSGEERPCFNEFSQPPLTPPIPSVLFKPIGIDPEQSSIGIVITFLGDLPLESDFIGGEA